MQNAAAAGAVGSDHLQRGPGGPHRRGLRHPRRRGRRSRRSTRASRSAQTLANGVAQRPDRDDRPHQDDDARREPEDRERDRRDARAASRRTSSWPAPTSTASPTGPGINDNGTGSATLLELARQISKLGVEPENKIRFAWWGAEEEGLIGSTEYVAGLKKEALAKIALYLNFDMIGSPNFARLIYDGDGSAFDTPGPKGSDKIERDVREALQARGPGHRGDRSSTVAPTTSRSSTPGSRPAACSRAPRRSRPRSSRSSTAARPAWRSTPATTRPATTSTTSVASGLKQMAPAVADAVARYSVSTESLGSRARSSKGKRR